MHQIMMGNIETNTLTEKDRLIESIRGELNALSLNIKKEAFKAREELKSETKRLGFYDLDESGENIKFNVINVKKYLESIKDKSWSELTIKSSNLERGVRTIAIQIAISYINNKIGGSTNNIDLIDGVRGSNTWRGVKEFQVRYELRNKDGLPGHETITKILELLGSDVGKNKQGNEQNLSDRKGNVPSIERKGNTPSIERKGDTSSAESGNISGVYIPNEQGVTIGNKLGTNVSTERINKFGTSHGYIISSKQRNIIGNGLGTDDLNAIGTSTGNRLNKQSEKKKEIKGIEDFIKKSGNQNNIDDKKCFSLLSSNKLEINDQNKNGNSILKSKALGNAFGESNNTGNSFENKLKKNGEKGGIEGAIFKNPEIQNILNDIVDQQGEELNIKKQKYEIKKLAENNIESNGKENKDSDQDKKEAIQSLEDYKHANFSREKFEEFVLSDEGRAIIVDEIKSHIDTSHTNENGEYDKFYENYPISKANLEIKLRSAWETKILKDYHKESGIYGDDKQLSEEERKAKEEEMEKLDVISNQITGYVDEIVGNNIKSGKNNFDQDILSELESLLSKGSNGATIDELFSDQKYKDTFKVVLGNKIKNYGILVRNGNNIDINTGDKQIDLQLKSYLYIYGRIFYSDYFGPNKNSGYYEDILPDIMRVIMSDDDTSLVNAIKHRELLELERKLEEERKERDLQRRQEAAMRNRERNSRSYNRGNGGRGFNTERNVSNDINEATGAEIVEMSGMDLSDIKVKGNIGESILDSGLAKQKAFGIAWANFKKSNIGIDNIVTPENMRDLYDVESKDINKNARENFLNSDIMLGRSQEEINKIYNILRSFSNEFSKAIKIVTSGAQKQEEIANEETKIHALGEVIDNVRDIFDIIVEKWEGNSEFEGFSFDKVDPVKREGDNIIMSGTFNGSNIKIRYDLNSGGLFINSFLQKSPGKIIIGNNTDANLSIGELDSFDTILDKHYRAPDISLNSKLQVRNVGNQSISNQDPGIKQGTPPSNSSENSSDNNSKTGFQPPISKIINKNKKKIEAIKQKYEDMLYAKIDMIGDKIMKNTKEQSAINSTITKFMKTFNIINDKQDDKTIEFNDSVYGSDLFDFLEIISNSDPNTLDKFQLFMSEITKLSGLNRGKNNINGPQDNLEPNIFNKDGQNENISMLRNSRKEFSDKAKLLKSKLSFESDYKFGFAQIVKKKLIAKGTNKPNRKLDDGTMMKKFFIEAGLTPPPGL